MCLFTKVVYAGYEHSGLLTGSSNVLLCDRTKDFHITNGFAITTAVCHPLSAEQETQFATEHFMLGYCEGCWPNQLEALDMSKQEVLELREHAQQDFNSYMNDEDEVEEQN
jgi:hypothetical protein